MARKSKAAKGVPGSPSDVKSENIEKTPAGLTEAINKRRCVLFAGAGISKGAGFPNWKELLIDLTDRALSESQITSVSGEEIRQMIEGGDRIHMLQAAEELRERIGTGDFRAWIAEVFRDNTKKPTPVHEELTKIDFRLAITTNYDKLLEHAYSRSADGIQPPDPTWQNASSFAEYLFKDEFCILKAHGDVHFPRSLVITERDYREIIYRSLGYKTALASVFTTKSILFLGASLMDPELWLLLGYLRDAFHGRATQHYALLPKGDYAKTELNRWRKDFKVHCIHYQPSDDSHPEVLEFLKTLPHEKPN